MGHARRDLITPPANVPQGDDLALDQRRAYERRDEVLVLFPESAKLGDAQVFLVEAPARLPGLSVWCGRVGVLDLDEPAAPACWPG
jgi:hypothetical protein